MDREKVIKGLEMCIKDIECTGCPYENDCFAPDDNPFGTSMMRDALALLKEQEAVIPLFNKIMKHFVCPNCSLVLDEGRDDYCPSCGKKIAWDEYYIHEDD